MDNPKQLRQENALLRKTFTMINNDLRMALAKSSATRIREQNYADSLEKLLKKHNIPLPENKPDSMK